MKALALALLLATAPEIPRLGQVTLGVQQVKAGDTAPAAGCWMSEAACTNIAQKVKDCSAVPPTPSAVFPVLMLLAGFVGGVVLTGWALHDRR